MINQDNWKHQNEGMKCKTCMWFMVKPQKPIPQENTAVEVRQRGCLGRCRRHSPTINGFPAVFEGDWCGDHKLDENKI